MSKTLTVNSRELVAELAWMARVGHRQSLAALNAVHVSALVGALQLRRTDFEIFAESTLYADGGGQASILLDPTKLTGVLKGERGPVGIDIGEDALTVRVGGRTITLRSAASLDDYPAWTTFVRDKTGAALLSPGEIARALTSVSDDDLFPNLTAVRFEDRVMVSTDRFKLSRINYTGAGLPMTALVPAAALRAFTRGDELVTVDRGKLGEDGVEGGLVHIFSGQRSIIARLLDAEESFPKWRLLVPEAETATVRVVIRRDELLGAIGADDHHITLTITGDGIGVIDADPDGDVEVQQQVSLISYQRGDGLPFTVRVAAKNLKACLRGVAAGVVHLEATAPSKPVVLRALNDKELHLIMPIRIPA
jgi:hypothetical protein